MPRILQVDSKPIVTPIVLGSTAFLCENIRYRLRCSSWQSCRPQRFHNDHRQTFGSRFNSGAGLVIDIHVIVLTRQRSSYISPNDPFKHSIIIVKGKSQMIKEASAIFFSPGKDTQVVNLVQIEHSKNAEDRNQFCHIHDLIVLPGNGQNHLLFNNQQGIAASRTFHDSHFKHFSNKMLALSIVISIGSVQVFIGIESSSHHLKCLTSSILLLSLSYRQPHCTKPSADTFQSNGPNFLYCYLLLVSIHLRF